jgi:cell division cycle 2-like protein
LRITLYPEKYQIHRINHPPDGGFDPRTPLTPFYRVYLVMDFLEHDLKTLLDDMREPFLPSEVKTLLLQFISGLDFLHSQWIMHRDLKTSNLLMNNRGELKIADFGMARYYGDPPPKLTQLVVTLWYRSPELLLGAETYGPEIDMWSLGCIFGELLTKEPLLQGKNEVDQVSKVHSDIFYLPQFVMSWS